MLLITSTANIKTWERDNGLYGGLSPLARGTRQNGLSSLVRLRFIPAGAGNTCFRKSMDYCYSVYPRWRGEHCSVVFILPACHGLSPLARGTLPYRLPDIIFLRFIPAGAGNTGARNTKPCICSVYPRWRGEHWLCNSSTHDHVGLSPLARGTRLNMYIYSLPYPVYPRWRGEHRLCLRLYRWWRGLSPLARGTLVMVSFL